MYGLRIHLQRLHIHNQETSLEVERQGSLKMDQQSLDILEVGQVDLILEKDLFGLLKLEDKN